MLLQLFVALLKLSLKYIVKKITSLYLISSVGRRPNYGGESKLESNKTLDLSEEMEKLLGRISSDLLNVLVELSGSQKAIGSGTLIKIPTDVGYVKLFKSPEHLQISVWLMEQMSDKTPTM